MHDAECHPVEYDRVHTLTCAQDCRCPLTRSEIQRRLRAERADPSSLEPRVLLGKYKCRLVMMRQKPGRSSDFMEVMDWTSSRLPTMREMDAALVVAESYGPTIDTVAFPGSGASTVRRCRACRRPVTGGPNLCMACGHMDRFRSHGEHAAERDYVADAQYMAEYAEWIATQYMTHGQWLVAQVSEFSRTCTHCTHVDRFLLMNEPALCPQCQREANPVMTRVV